jgi:hypothetical protein
MIIKKEIRDIGINKYKWMKEIKEDGDVEEKNGNVKDFSIISK